MIVLPSLPSLPSLLVTPETIAVEAGMCTGESGGNVPSA
jgi:hypothetical protein